MALNSLFKLFKFLPSFLHNFNFLQFRFFHGLEEFSPELFLTCGNPDNAYSAPNHLNTWLDFSHFPSVFNHSIYPRNLTSCPSNRQTFLSLMTAKHWMAFSLLCDWLKNIHSTNQILRPKPSRLGHLRFPALSANLVLGRSKKELHFQIIRKSTDIEWKKTSFDQRW